MSLDPRVRNSFVLLFSLLLLGSCKVRGSTNVFNVIKYGGVPSKTVDNSKALLKAWHDACNHKGNSEAQLVIPKGDYLLDTVKLDGPCKGPIKFENQGTIWAQPGPTRLEYGIKFSHVDSLTISGGTYDGQGQTVWGIPGGVGGVPDHYTHLVLYHVTNSVVQQVKIMNSKKFHIYVLGSKNVELNGVTLSTPGTVRCSDGIKLTSSDTINIHDSSLAVGDDCVAILSGTSNVNVTRVVCGPGHGFSIGSLGSTPGQFVKGIRVHNCTVNGASNGVRIKTKLINNNPGRVSDVWFDDVVMNDVDNPIIIDQRYGPRGSKGESRVQIDGVRYSNIRGTSKTQVAINLSCSKSNPCTNIKMSDINLSYAKSGVKATSSCSNAKVDVSGKINPGLHCSS